MASLQIIKNTNGYFTFVLDGDTNGAIIDNSPNLTSLDNGNLCHFKTANGASLFKNQNISYADVTYTDITATDFTFANIGQLWQKLITEEFFKGLNQGSGSGATRFDDLLDTFDYIGNDEKVPVVDASQLKLVPVTFYNYNEFIHMDDVAISELVADKILSVQIVGGNPKIVLSDKPDTTQQLVNAMGYLDYNDAGTTITPLTLVSNVDKKLTNDTLGAFTDTSQRPFGVPSIWNTDNNQFDFQYLTIGDTLDMRVDVTVTTTAVNQRVKVFLRLAVGSASQYDLPIADVLFKTAGTYQMVEYEGIYIGSANFKDFPAELYVITDAAGTCIVNGWYTRIFRKSVNLVNFTIDEDLIADHYRGTWNASTNTPTLTNGFGQVGDYYKVSVAGSGYSIGDIIGYDGMVYYKKVNNNPLQTELFTIQFSGVVSMSNFTDWYARTRTSINIYGQSYTAYTGLSSANAFADDQNTLPNYVIPFNHKVHSAFGHFRVNTSGIIPVEFAIRTFDFPNGGNDGTSATAINNAIVAKKIITQTNGGAQPNVEFTGTELNTSYTGSKNAMVKLYLKNNFGASIGNVGFNITIVFEKI